MKRVQMKRVKGWRKPANTIYVGRPTKYGNPFAVNSLRTKEEAVAEYELWLKRILTDNPSFLEPLKGKDLACWCPLDKPCHADVILKYLNRGKGEAVE